MNKRNIILAIHSIVIIFIAGCTQDKSGLTGAEVDVGLYDKNQKTPYVKKVRFTDGKEKDYVSVTVKFKDGKPTITYSANGITAFEGQRIRAEVHKELTKAGQNIAPAILETILKSVGVP